MVFYAQTGLCRWRVLLEYFDQEPPFEGEHCGHCDNCLNFAAAQEAAQASVTAEAQPSVATQAPVANEAIPAAALQEQPCPQAVTPGPASVLPEPPAPAAPPSLRKPSKPMSLSTPALFQVGEAVRVPRYGSGRVASASAEEVAIQFPDGRTRRFVAQYVQREEGIARGQASTPGIAAA
jgi:ATP-dependent DNA helicase RecQ